MKDFFIGVLHCVIFTLFVIVGTLTMYGMRHRQPIVEKYEINTLYPLTTIITAVDAENDVVECQDCNGNVWEFTGCDDWQVEDVASLIVFNNKTDDITDDEIIMANYGGRFES